MLACGILNERRLVLVEQDPSHTAIKGIAHIDSDIRQIITAKKRTASNADDAVGDRDVGQGAAITKPCSQGW